ncbi:hypothetical protein Msil_1929 [Methylocella silvestris BL2]|uniref:Uncharacterized protein n=1 Tax=Methylocella silvestris (strain DSM 15510 / CIP 108128 / LMG 27833 / NCIMB 13906 / BL2) TaxID=395965 RepID=B8ENT8_METSB|nr:hypothetical protein Msil_1929 [Methylocella silvestris BL2]
MRAGSILVGQSCSPRSPYVEIGGTRRSGLGRLQQAHMALAMHHVVMTLVMIIVVAIMHIAVSHHFMMMPMVHPFMHLSLFSTG